MKKKILMLAIAACLIVLSIAGSSLAYFTDTDAKTTTFTSGNVDINLNFNADAVKSEVMFPGMSYAYPATIENVGTYDAYVGAIIEATPDTIKTIFAGLKKTGYTVETAGNKIYVVMDAALKKGEEATVFSGITIPAEWDNDDMAAFKTANLKITAYATQTVGFADGTTAIQALGLAFKGVWDVTFDAPTP